MEEFWELFDSFNPREMCISRINGEIKLDLSALENITLAILSDR